MGAFNMNRTSMTVFSTPRTIITDRGDAGRRLDLVLRRHLADLGLATRTQIQAWIENGQVNIDGRPVHRVATRATSGARVSIVLPNHEARPQPTAEDLPLDIVYEDDHLLAIDKPAGMVVHPGYRHTAGTLLNALLWRARGWRKGERPSLVGRLDRLTSGLVIVAKTAAVHAAMQRVRQAAASHREYLAIVYGRAKPRGAVEFRLAADPSRRRTVVVAPAHGAACLTRFDRLGHVAAPNVGLSLLRCRLVTGRRHQIRVHLAASGWPLVGDPDYGEPRWTRIVDMMLADTVRAFPRQALHSWRATFVHPVTHERLVLEAPVPADVAGLLAASGLREFWAVRR
jgi:23S rRNA pseudouridine1911/1915/1917 synthase